LISQQKLREKPNHLFKKYTTKRKICQENITIFNAFSLVKPGLTITVKPFFIKKNKQKRGVIGCSVKPGVW
jgi:hypothetical protein